MNFDKLSEYFSRRRVVALLLWLLALLAVPLGLELLEWIPSGTAFIPFSIIAFAGLAVFFDSVSFRIGLFLVLVLAVFYLVKPDGFSLFLDGLNYRIQDAYFKIRGPQKNTGQVVIVDIDNKSLQELGQWPWSRVLIAKGIQHMLDDGVGALGFDIVFAEPDRLSLKPWLDKAKRLYSLEESGVVLGDSISKKNIEHIVVQEWKERLREYNPDLEWDDTWDFDKKKQFLAQAFQEFYPYAPQDKSLSLDQLYEQMLRFSRELFFLDIDWGKADPLSETPALIQDSDTYFSRIFSDPRIVAGGYFNFSVNHRWYEDPEALKQLGKPESPSMVVNQSVQKVDEVFVSLKKASEQILNISTIQKRVQQQGAFNIVPDPSGAARYYTHLVQAPVFLKSVVLKEALPGEEIDIFDPDNYEEKITAEFLTYPSISLTMLRVANNYDTATAVDRGFIKGVLLENKKGFEPKSFTPQAKEVSFESLFASPKDFYGQEYFLPLDFKGDLIINFMGEGGKWSPSSQWSKEYYFPYISFSDVLYQRFEKGFFENKYVIFGSTDPTLQDLVGSPYRSAFPGLEVHATMLDNMLSRRFLLDYGDATVLATFFAVLVLGVLLVISWSYTSFWFGFLLTNFFLAGIPYSAYILFKDYYLIIEYIYLWLALALTASLVLLVNYFVEGRQRRFIADQFSSLVSKEVLKKLTDDPDSISLEGQKTQASVFFSDLAGFTSISEKISTKELVSLLNDYFSPMTEIILAHDGFIDKFIGDAIMAVWGVPFGDKKHAQKACLAALEQQKALEKLAHEIQEKHQIDVSARMGIASGELAAAMTGSEKRKNYTVLGDVVNLSARLEPTCKDYGVKILISEQTYLQAKDAVSARCLDKLVVKGKTIPIPVYELVAPKSETSTSQQKLIDEYENALHLYWERQWEQAEAVIHNLLKEFPEDVASTVLLARIEAFKKAPPPEDWQGEYVKKTK